jgi:hypothetical protein
MTGIAFKKEKGITGTTNAGARTTAYSLWVQKILPKGECYTGRIPTASYCVQK